MSCGDRLDNELQPNNRSDFLEGAGNVCYH